eukprot:m.122397 g.122397  ORF g.122397 m.122397 type:complete len:83 (-) comp13730_c0_seq2:1326-1574(-)
MYFQIIEFEKTLCYNSFSSICFDVVPSGKEHWHTNIRLALLDVTAHLNLVPLKRWQKQKRKGGRTPFTLSDMGKVKLTKPSL